MSWLTEPFSLGFMQRALAASLIVGVLCAVVGCYVVLRSMAFLGDALAHAILPGVAVAFLVGGNLLVGALIAAVVVAAGISYVSRSGVVREDTAIGIFFAAALALGVVLISTMEGYAVDLTHVLFGNVLGVSEGDLWLSGGLALLVLAAVGLLYRRLLVVSFDPVFGQTLGLRTGLLRTTLFMMLALTIVVLAAYCRGRARCCHARDSTCYRLSRDTKTGDDDGAVSVSGCSGFRRWTVSELLPRCLSERGHGAAGDGILHDHFRIVAAEGSCEDVEAQAQA